MVDDDSVATPTPIPDEHEGRRGGGMRPGTVALSRYILLDRLGSGSVGVVYRAYDPQLDRKVALKLLRARRRSPRREAALLREAQAMAMFSHPNVITVHDVGSYDEQDLGLGQGESLRAMEIPSRGVFIVMELIEGRDLRRWIHAERRDWREIVEVFLAAGRGLAAAHAVGLVHRDFKPTNVCVGDDGRVCVLDFGLARPQSDSTGEASRTGERRAKIVGTPLYMSPEQHRGEPATVLSDQYSFGVALHEALTGRGPWAGDLEEVAARKQEQEWPEPPAGTATARVWAVVRRAMAYSPGERYPSMGRLLADLEACVGSLRRRFIAVSGLAAVLALGLVASLVRPTNTEQCTGAEEQVAAVWNQEARARVEAQLLGSGVRYAGTTWAEVERTLDEYALDWTRHYREACEATQVRGEQSAAVLDLRMTCLARRLDEVAVVVETLAEADAAVVEHAVVTVNVLGWLDACDDLDALRSAVSLPNDPGLRARVEQGYAQLARSRVNEAAGRYDLALTLAEGARDEGVSLGHRPLLAAAELHRAVALEGQGDLGRARQMLIDAYAEAEAAGEEAVVADAALRLLWIVGAEQGRGEEAEIWLRLAEAAIERQGNDRLRAAILIHNRAGLRDAQGHYELALADYEQALEAQRDLLGESDPVVARTLNHIANVLIDLERYDDAWVHSERSLATRIATLGAEHPLVAACYNNMAVIRRQQGRLAEARKLVAKALEITEGTGTRTEAVSLVIAKNIDIALADHQSARLHLLRLLALSDDRLPRWTSRLELRAQLEGLDDGARAE